LGQELGILPLVPQLLLDPGPPQHPAAIYDDVGPPGQEFASQKSPVRPADLPLEVAQLRAADAGECQGKNASRTFDFPRNDDRVTSLPEVEGRVNSGADSPEWGYPTKTIQP
jgi:hypothetical protein